MPEGLTNAPTAFQHFMNDIFADLLNLGVIVYLNDILIYSETLEEHRKLMKEVLRCLRKNRLYANAKKCTFHTDTVNYLGFILSLDGLTMDPAKVTSIQDWLEPQKVWDIQSFLGFANFSQRFIPYYSNITIPLTRLTRKSVSWNFDEECRTTFNTLKKAFTTTPVLANWAPELQTIVETNASDYAVAAILSVITSDGEIHPVAFHSQALHNAELNYDTHDKELLAIFDAFRTWQHYLEGVHLPTDVITDHKNLEYFSTVRLLTCRQVRWSEFLCHFNMVICFRPGKLRTKPDYLTCHWDLYRKEGDSGYASANPHNFRPVFTSEHLSYSLHANSLYEPIL
jgi:hypothetical protein